MILPLVKGGVRNNIVFSPNQLFCTGQHETLEFLGKNLPQVTLDKLFTGT